MNKNFNKFYRKLGKRIFDLLISTIAIIVLVPVYIIISILVFINFGRPILFKQKRPGINEKEFFIYKFRSMSQKTDQDGILLSDSKRLTKFGRFLRAASLDELPELINIIKGDMSLVGPRPQLYKDLIFMTKKQKMRQSIRPGLTGLAQVSGRNDISWDEKLRIDLIYLSKISFLLDIKILLKTIVKVIKRDGINTNGTDSSLDYGDYLLKEGKITEEYYVSIHKRCTFEEDK